MLVEVHNDRNCLARTPIADALILLADRPIVSFHALPIFQSSSLRQSSFYNRYGKIFGSRVMNHDATISGNAFDSFFFADGVIYESEELTARAFGADGALYVTVGTTVSNQIAIASLAQAGGKVLVDKACHQSIHFSLATLGVTVSHLESTWRCDSTQRTSWSLQHLIDAVNQADIEGRPFDLIVLNASSYDGIVLNVPETIRAILATGTRTRRFLIDEAWGAADYFGVASKTRCAMAARELCAQYPGLEIVATQSAHKTLTCLRQASIILYLGSYDLAERLKVSQFRLHTTSPSYLILASLDLARAQMALEGELLVHAALESAEKFKSAIRSDPTLSLYKINEDDGFRQCNPLVTLDQTKVSIDVSALRVKSEKLRDRLYRQYSIYINRFTETSLLLNFHIGVAQTETIKLLNALRDIQQRESGRAQALTDNSKFIVSYPPGVPISHPFELKTTNLGEEIEKYHASGIHVFAA